MSQFVKASLLLLGGFAAQYAITPPHPPAAPSERSKSNLVEDLLRVPFSRLIPHIALATNVLAEVAAILCLAALHTPVHPTLENCAAALLPHLQFPGGDLNNIRLTPRILLGLAVACGGSFIRWQSYRALGRFFTFEMSIKKDHRLVKDGPYAVVRHPGYLGVTLVLAGSLLTFASPGSWLRESGALNTWIGKPLVTVACAVPVAITAGLFHRLPREDDVLRKEFGAEWEQWAKDVPYKLIPYVY